MGRLCRRENQAEKALQTVSQSFKEQQSEQEREQLA
jgi:hypothetical protein